MTFHSFSCTIVPTPKEAITNVIAVDIYVRTADNKLKLKHQKLGFHLWSYFPLNFAEELPHCNMSHLKISSLLPAAQNGEEPETATFHSLYTLNKY